MSNYEFIGPSWAGATVSWYYSGNASFSAEIARAFARWDAVIDLDFVRASSASAADITLSFGAIDGASNTLAEAYSVWSGSYFTGDSSITFDSAEAWSYSAAAGGYALDGDETFLAVALHEIGHTLGLDHSTNSATLMYAYASAAVTDLTYWDIYAARLLYGAESSGTSSLFTDGDDVITLTATSGAPEYALGGNDTVTGTTAIDWIYGDAGADRLFGLQGADQLTGGDGYDVLTGGTGADQLTGGAGTDYFDFNVYSETGKTLTTSDVIKDFDALDYIDLSTIDANTRLAGDQKFAFYGRQGFHKIAGELHYVKAAGYLLVQGDLNGDGRADFQIKVDGLGYIGKSDFVL
jgi:Ca2+-binding RTX toxin-like protein